MITYTLPALIAPSLQAAAQRMPWPEFNAVTEQIRGLHLAGDPENLTRLIEGHGMASCPEVVGQILSARACFFGESIRPPLIDQFVSYQKRSSKDQTNFTAYEIKTNFLAIAHSSSFQGQAIFDVTRGMVRRSQESSVTEALIESLSHPNLLIREHAAYLLVETGEAAIDPLIRLLVGKQAPQAIGPAMFALFNQGLPPVKRLVQTMKDRGLSRDDLRQFTTLLAQFETYYFRQRALRESQVGGDIYRPYDRTRPDLPLITKFVISSFES